MRSSLIARMALLASLAACSSSPSSPQGAENATDAAPSEADLVDCATDPLAQTYADNMLQEGVSREFWFALVRSTPEPPAVGTDTWVIRVLDNEGNSLVGVTFPADPTWPPGWPVGVFPYMPHHGHASSSYPTVTSNTDGTYAIGGLYLFMGGLWEVTIRAQRGSQVDSAVFAFCLPG